MSYRGGNEIAAALEEAAGVVAARPGCRRVDILRSPDDGQGWLLLSEWLDAGSMRHGLGSFEAKMALGPLQSSAADEGGVFEVLARYEEGRFVVRPTDRAADADTAGPLR
jgi:hypothetical protein